MHLMFNQKVDTVFNYDPLLFLKFDTKLLIELTNEGIVDLDQTEVKVSI